MTPRCAGCDGPVAKVGQTCSFECYTHMCYMLQIDPRVKDRPLTLEEQPWYEKVAFNILEVADEHEI